ncbi:MAG TPA: ATP-binding protein [Rubrobacteraceae bacterium]|nr:ATP-binding protein [Rubrobacteraceae bacterium]
MALLRIVQEALVNVGKHANASRVDVRLDRREGYLILTVRDDGAGLGPNGNEGTGIGSMRERAELLGGALQFDGVVGTGTNLTVRIPVEG